MEKSLSSDLIQLLGDNCKQFEFIPLETALSGKFDGAYCLANRYWMIVQDHIAVYVGSKFNETYSPQCNLSEKTIKYMLEKYSRETGYFHGFECRVDYIEYCYIDGDRYFRS